MLTFCSQFLPITSAKISIGVGVDKAGKAGTGSWRHRAQSKCAEGMEFVEGALLNEELICWVFDNQASVCDRDEL